MYEDTVTLIQHVRKKRHQGYGYNDYQYHKLRESLTVRDCFSILRQCKNYPPIMKNNEHIQNMRSFIKQKQGGGRRENKLEKFLRYVSEAIVCLVRRHRSSFETLVNDISVNKITVDGHDFLLNTEYFTFYRHSILQQFSNFLIPTTPREIHFVDQTKYLNIFRTVCYKTKDLKLENGFLVTNHSFKHWGYSSKCLEYAQRVVEKSILEDE